jgi:hypothetical protein
MAPPPPKTPQKDYNPVYIQKEPEPQGDEWPIPTLHLRVWDIASPGSGTFFANVQVPSLLKESVIRVLNQLYTPATAPDK